MTDRELLELAAKAAGYHVEPRDDNALAIERDGRWWPWNPHTDGGDAFRLAVDLGLVVEIGDAARGFVAVRTNTDNWQEFREAWGADPYAATRRAIVRAAAEVQRTMENNDAGQ